MNGENGKVKIHHEVQCTCSGAACKIGWRLSVGAQREIDRAGGGGVNDIM